MKELEFKCPQCGCKGLDEKVSAGVVVYNKVAIFPDGSVVYEEEEVVHETPQVHYACRKCEMRLDGARDAKSLVQWINFNCTFSVKTIREKLGVSEQQAQDIRAIIFDLEPLQYKGESISTAERHLTNAGFCGGYSFDDRHEAVIRAVTLITGSQNDKLTKMRWLWWASGSDTEYCLVYCTEDEYYFWATAKDLNKLEEQWKKKNNS